MLNLGMGQQNINAENQPNPYPDSSGILGGMDYWSQQIAQQYPQAPELVPMPAPAYTPAPMYMPPAQAAQAASEYMPAPSYTPTPTAATYAPAPAPTLRGYEKNPYLDEMAGNITGQMGENLNRNILPSIRSGAQAAGGYGGSRQGVVEANALNDMNRSLGQNLTNLYGQDYNQSQARNMQQYGLDQGFNLGQGNLALGNKSSDQNYNLGQGNLALGNKSSDQNYNLGQGNLALGNMNANNNYNLGLRSNDLGYANLDANIAQSNFGNQMTGAQFGLNAYNTLQANNNLGLGAGTTIQNTPLTYQQGFGNTANAAGGLGGQVASTGAGMQGSPLTGALGGLQLANAFTRNNPYGNTYGVNSGSNPYSLGTSQSNIGFKYP